MKKILLSSLVLTMGLASLNYLAPATSIQKVEASENVSVAAVTKYADYKNGQYWSSDMLWAIDYGLISGYKGVKNTKTGKVENLIKPYGNLTEAQMIAVLFRYAKPNELATTKPLAPNWFASTSYQLAEKYKIPTKASLKNTKAAGQTVSRGDLAKAMASLYKGVTVNGKEAVQFMYEANLTTGLADKSGDYPRTYESFGVNEKLTRANIVSFMKRYDAFLEAKGQKPEKPVFIEPSQENVVGDIKVRYGMHTYGSRNQKEYDVVMEALDKALRTEHDYLWDVTGRADKYYEEYLNGARPYIRDRSHPNVREERNMFLISAEGNLKDMVENGISANAIRELQKIRLASSLLLKDTRDPGTGGPRSAYDAIALGLADCDPIAHIESAVYDAKGYNTVVIARPGHAWAAVEVENQWIALNGIGYEVIDLPDILKNKSMRVLAQPTNGKRIGNR